MSFEYTDTLPEEAFFEFIVCNTEIPAYCHSMFTGKNPAALFKRVGFIEVANEEAISHLLTIKHNEKHFIPVVIKLDDSRIGFVYHPEGRPIVRFCSVAKTDYRALFRGDIKIFKIADMAVTYLRTDQALEVTIYK